MTQTLDRKGKLLDVREACEFLQISRAVLYRMMAEGELGYVQLGRRRRFRATDLEVLIEKHAVAAR